MRIGETLKALAFMIIVPAFLIVAALGYVEWSDSSAGVGKTDQIQMVQQFQVSADTVVTDPELANQVTQLNQDQADANETNSKANLNNATADEKRSNARTEAVESVSGQVFVWAVLLFVVILVIGKAGGNGK